MSEVHVEAEGLLLNAIVGRLESLGWDVEYATRFDMKITRPDPETGHAMQFAEYWLDWRMVDGQLAYGVADDRADPWRTQLAPASPDDPREVADAADRAMHMLWHLDEQTLRAELYAKNERLNRIMRRVEGLARRMLITPGMLRETLRDEPEARP